jgi:hypothetical protein
VRLRPARDELLGGGAGNAVVGQDEVNTRPPRPAARGETIANPPRGRIRQGPNQDEAVPGQEDGAVRERLGSTARLAAPPLAALVILVLLVVAGRLPVTLTSVPSTTNASRSVAGVPDVVGRQLGQAQAVMRKAGLVGVAYERDPQGSDSVVVAQEPPAGSTAPLGSTVGFRTRAP